MPPPSKFKKKLRAQAALAQWASAQGLHWSSEKHIGCYDFYEYSYYLLTIRNWEHHMIRWMDAYRDEKGIQRMPKYK